MNRHTHWAKKLLDTLAGALLGATVVALGWSLFEGFSISGKAVSVLDAVGISATAAGALALVSLPGALIAGALWRSSKLGGRLRDAVAAHPYRAISLLTAAMVVVLAVSYATFAGSTLAAKLFASEQVRSIALAGTIPFVALVAIALARFAAERLQSVLPRISAKAVLTGGLAGAAVLLLAWAGSFVLLAPKVFAQLDLQAFVPLLIVPAGAVVGSLLPAHCVVAITAGVGTVLLGSLAGLHLSAEQNGALQARLDQHGPGTAYVMRLVAPPEVKVPVATGTGSGSAVCKPGQPAPHASHVGKVDEEAPDIILVTVDALRWDHTPMSGYKRNTMPNLRRHAKKGAMFENAYTTGSTTRQSFRSMFSGVYSSRVEAPKSTKWGLSFADDQETLASYLDAAGYHTVALSCDTGAFPKQYGAMRGFEVVDESPVEERKKKKYSVPYKVDRIISHLSDPEVDGPRFVWTHLLESHQWYEEGPDPVHYGKKEADQYDESLHFIDGELDRLIDFARSPDRRRRTIVIVTADHGQQFFEHGFRFHGATIYDEETNVPFLVWGPNIKPKRYKTPVSLIDLVPTVLDLVGLKVPEALCGESLRESLVKGKEPEKRPVYTETLPDKTWDFFSVGWVDGDEKVVLRPNKNIVQLFDLSEDPDEKKNLAKKRPKRLKKHLKALREFYREHGLDPADYGLED